MPPAPSGAVIRYGPIWLPAGSMWMRKRSPLPARRSHCTFRPISLHLASDNTPDCQTSLRLLDQAAVFFEGFTQPLVRDGVNRVAVDAGHGFGGDEGVDDRLLSGLNGGGEERRDSFVRKHRHGGDFRFLSGCSVRG